jgi:hypothetical protein
LVICIVTLVLALFGLTGVARRGKDATVSRFSGVLSALFVSLIFMTLLVSIYQLPAAATVTQLLPYYLGAWSFIGLHGFFMVFFLLGTAYFQKRVWAIFLPVLGTLSYLLLVWVLPTPSTVTLVSDGVLNYVGMPMTLIAYAGILAIIYMLLIPFIAIYGIAKKQKGAAKGWAWSCWVSYFLWFIAALLFALAPYTASYALYAFALAAIAWILISISYVFYERASAAKPKR